MKNTLSRALSLLAACALLLVSLPASLALPLAAKDTAPAYTAEAVYPAPKPDASVSGTQTGAMQARDTDVVGMQFVLTAPALAVSTAVPSYSNNTGSATMALFRFDTDYDTSLLSDPLAEHTFWIFTTAPT